MGRPTGSLFLKAYIQPFERRLATAELTGLGIEVLAAHPGQYEYEVAFPAGQGMSPARVADRLAYFDALSLNVHRATLQARRELAGSLHSGRRKALPTRRVLRYGPHDLHEYRGKFFPQLVRSLCNVSGMRADSVVLDPMCGSGTALVEARALDMRAAGLDRNPLSVLVTRVKTDSVGWDSSLAAEAERIADIPLGQLDHPGGQDRWSPDDTGYLRRWFAPAALLELERILGAVDSISNDQLRDFARVCLSDILRSVSFQSLEDLRVRKAIRPYSEGSTTTLFRKKVREAALQIGGMGRVDPGHRKEFNVKLGDINRLGELFPDLRAAVDLVVTSPPYATALPYLDTDRLSLVVLGLLPRNQHKSAEEEMIGTREVTERRRKELWAQYKRERSRLPQSITELVDRIADAYDSPVVGFRRRNLPALLGTYFIRMKSALGQIQQVLRPGARAFVVVGNNSTISQGTRVEIPTDHLLSDIARQLGFTVASPFNMELLASRDIFVRNRGSREQLLEFVKT